ncbi:MAG: hypothetical protein ACYTGV_06950 [Planctomycetota bacterium]|jgi:hypothetical protein
MKRDEMTGASPEPEGTGNFRVTRVQDAESRLRRLTEVLERLRKGELDSELAAVETALALLDGDSPEV